MKRRDRQLFEDVSTKLEASAQSSLPHSGPTYHCCAVAPCADCPMRSAQLALRRTLEPHPKWGLLLDIIDQTVTDVARAHAASTAHQDIRGRTRADGVPFTSTS